jgi:hypothetical protein
MKRTFAAVALLAALGLFCKLAFRPPLPRRIEPPPVPAPVAAAAAAPGPEEALRARYTAPRDRALVERTLARYRRNAVAIERTDGLRGLALLDRLDLEAIFLYEQHPDEFRLLRDALTDDAAADLLLHWREYFGLKRADDIDRGLLIAEIARLSPAQRRAAARHPGALPLILAEPSGVTDLVERAEDAPRELADALAVLEFISLEPGAADLRAALRVFDDHGALALDAFRLQGLDGFALVVLYGPVLAALGDALPLDQALIVLRVNSDYVDELLRSHEPETVARHVRHIGARGLVEAACGSPGALRLVVEHGARGERALAQAGPDAADVVYGDFADAGLRNQAVAALAEHGPMALAMLDKYATDPDFREVLRTWGAAAIGPIARADAAPEALAALRARDDRSFTESLALSVLFLAGDNGQRTIRLIRQDGLDRVSALEQTDVAYYQFLPMYDLLHLGNVLRRGQAPTTGETAWALVDGCFVIADALSLLAVQPEGAVAAEAARSELKAATRAAAQAAGRELAGDGAEAATGQLARWWAVRHAGGTYRLLRRLPEALPRLSLPEAAALARPLCARAGLRLTAWTPLRFVRDGKDVLLRVPAGRGLTYAAAQGAQAGVGVVAYRKMEEHLASRRPARR